LIALLASALFWNILTWWFGLPNSSSHCLIGALIGVSVGNALAHSHGLAQGVHWHQLTTVLEGLALSPVLGFLLAGGLYLVTRKTVHDPHLYEPAGDKPPVWWMRAILVFTCTGVSFAHGTNDGQKSIGMIMLTIIGLFPATYALNPEAGHALTDLPAVMQQAQPLIEKYGDDQKRLALEAARSVQSQGSGITRLASAATTDSGQPVGLGSDAAQKRAGVRDNIYRVIAQLKHVEDAGEVSDNDKKQAKELARQLGKTVEYAPWWVRILSAVCLGVGTMIGYKRIVTTLGERLGKIHMTPAQGAAAEVVSAAVIGVAGFTGLPVSTTHIVTSGIGGTMVSAGAGLQYGTISRIVMAWVFTLPVTILISAAMYYVLVSPRLGS
jgi:inorganic phosphate transporter, PiT family